jgi:hypothetical protein
VAGRLSHPGCAQTCAKTYTGTHASCTHIQSCTHTPPPENAARCLDQYFELRRKEVEGGEDGPPPDPRLVAVVERMLETAVAAGQWEQAVGVALEARRLDLLEGVVERCPDKVRRLGAGGWFWFGLE